MSRLIICIGYLLGVSALVLIVFSILVIIKCWVEDQDRLEIQMKIDEARRKLTPPWSVSGYYSLIEEAGVEIQNQKKPVDQVIVLWWGLDGFRLNEDGSTEWISRKKQKEAGPKPVNQNVFYQPQQYMDMAHTVHPLDMRNMVQSTWGHIEALRDTERICATAQMQQMQMQLPRLTLQMIYPYGYIPFPQYPYAQYYQGNLNGCCCDGSIMR